MNIGWRDLGIYITPDTREEYKVIAQIYGLLKSSEGIRVGDYIDPVDSIPDTNAEVIGKSDY